PAARRADTVQNEIFKEKAHWRSLIVPRMNLLAQAFLSRFDIPHNRGKIREKAVLPARILKGAKVTRPGFLYMLAATLGVSLAVPPLAAHHSFAAEFDQNKPITLQGVVTKIEWMNPHVFFYIDVKDASGSVVNWGLEGIPPNMLYRQGWRKDS